MGRRKRASYSRSQYPDQEDSTFLFFPREIRDLIYQFALTKPTPIDLCPPLALDDTQKQEIPEVKARLIEEAKGKLIRNWSATSNVRHVVDLIHVRKQMATGLLATCTQCWDEGWRCFWQDNTFRMSCDRDWEVARRFLTTIGPRARGLIRNVQFFAPYEDLLDTHYTPLLRLPQDDAAKRLIDRAKNHPKLRMTKLSGGGSIAENIDFLLDMLKREKPDNLKSVQFLVPTGWAFSERAWLIQTSWRFGSPQAAIPVPFFNSFTSVDWLTKVVVVQHGAWLIGSGIVDIFHREGLDVVFEPGSFGPSENGPPGPEEFIEMATAVSLPVKDKSEEVLGSLKGLFHVDDTALPARGGRATSKPLKLARHLKGFGGCKFAAYEGWLCYMCGSKPRRIKTRPDGGLYFPLQQDCPRPLPVTQTPDSTPSCVFTHVDGVFLKRPARAHQMGVVQERVRGRHWHGIW